MRFETICVAGLGYIGLPTAAIFASRGCNVIGVDVNESVVNTINRGEIHIVEPELDIAVRSVVNTEHLRAVSHPEEADAYLVAVPTPFKGDHDPDLSYIESAARSIAPKLKPGNLVVLESTSPVGATESMCQWMAEERPDLSFPTTHGENSDIRVAHCPERVLPGQVLRELVENDRIIGGITPKCAEEAVELYQMVVQGACIKTEARTAELTKLTENAFRDVNIAFANELSMVCDKLGVDVWELISLANHHPRVNVLNPGTGVGGHCIAVDPWFIVSSAPEESKLIRLAREINGYKPTYVSEKIASHARKNGLNSIACLGLAFKPNVDDMRESPSVIVVNELAKRSNIEILVVEPYASVLPDSLKRDGKIRLVSLEEAVEEADGFAGLVRHDVFVEFFQKHPDISRKCLDFVNIVK